MPRFKVAWRGSNAKSDHVGAYIYGMNNPFPGKVIDKIKFHAAENNTKWMVMGITLADKPVYFKPDMVSTGIPDNWGAAAVVYALVEGLIGVKDTGVAFNNITLAPRWPASDVKKASAVVKYEASGGYLAYNYHWRTQENELELLFTGSATETTLNLLLPMGAKPTSLTWNGQEHGFRVEKIEGSNYLSTVIQSLGIHQLIVKL
jgi:hypothetical protein